MLKKVEFAEIFDFWVMFQNFSEAKRVVAQNLSLPSSQSFGRSMNSGGSSFRYLQGLLDDVRIYDRALSAVFWFSVAFDFLNALEKKGGREAGECGGSGWQVGACV